MNDIKAKQQLQEMVDNIAHDIQYGMISGYDYLQDCLDIQYIVTGGSEYLGARVLVAFGGPNIWINTQSELVEANWWGDYAVARIDGDSMGLDDALRELWECK